MLGGVLALTALIWAQPAAAAFPAPFICPRIIWVTTPTRAAMTKALRTRAMMSSMSVKPRRAGVRVDMGRGKLDVAGVVFVLLHVA